MRRRRARCACLDRILKLRDRIDLGFILEGLEDMMDRTAHGLNRIHQIVAGLRNFARLDEAESSRKQMSTKGSFPR